MKTITALVTATALTATVATGAFATEIKPLTPVKATQAEFAGLSLQQLLALGFTLVAAQAIIANGTD